VERWIRNSILFIFTIIVVGACQKAPSIPSVILPPGELADDRNAPIPSVPSSNGGSSSIQRTEQVSSSNDSVVSSGGGIRTYLPSPPTVPQRRTNMVLTPGG
jgi:hypothetical protein